MTLLNNNFRHGMAGGRYFGATAISGMNPTMLRGRFNAGTVRACMYSGEGMSSNLASTPNGASHPNVFVMARTAGAIKSYRLGGLAINATATGELGLPTTGSSSITITGTCAGGLIVGATGTATISINGTAAIVATLNATGAVTITIDGNVAMGAEASITGTGTITLDGHADAMALGYMTGTTEEAGLTPSGIARAVWQQIIEAGFSAEEILRLLAAHAAGSATGLEGSNPQFTGLDGITVRIDGTYAGGTRTIDALNGE
jgi:hypothetical protein